jgi:hypothetical protein
MAVWRIDIWTFINNWAHKGHGLFAIVTFAVIILKILVADHNKVFSLPPCPGAKHEIVSIKKGNKGCENRKPMLS